MSQVLHTIDDLTTQACDLDGTEWRHHHVESGPGNCQRLKLESCQSPVPAFLGQSSLLKDSGEPEEGLVGRSDTTRDVNSTFVIKPSSGTLG